MAGSVNKVILIGNLGADPEVKNMNNGKPVANLRVATSESWKAQSRPESARRRPAMAPVMVIWNENLAGKVAEKYLKKGSKVLLSKAS